MKQKTIQNRAGVGIGSVIIWTILFIIALATLQEKPIKFQENLGKRIYCQGIPDGFLIGIAENRLAIASETGAYIDTSMSSLCSFDRKGSIQVMATGFEMYWNKFRSESEGGVPEKK